MAITERKQRCGLEGELATTKICFTYPDASWVCRQPRTDQDCDRGQTVSSSSGIESIEVITFAAG